MAPCTPDTHVHSHAVFAVFDVTEEALLLQCVADVHCVQVGWLTKPTAHSLQVAPCTPGTHVHSHAVLAVFDVTEEALLLQCVADVHCVQVGWLM